VIRKENFGEWLQQALFFIKLEPWIWCGYTLAVALILSVGKVSLAFGVCAAVTCLFVGVGVSKYIDMRHARQTNQPVSWAINKSLPLALLAGFAMAACWFAFMAFSHLLSGEYGKIVDFFLQLDFSDAHLRRKNVREITSWLYDYANMAFIFTLLMLCTFGSWFSYPLMLFQDYSWSRAKSLGDSTLATRKKTYYNMLAFLIFEALMCSSLTPLLTPVLYMLTSTLMYVSYKNMFELKASS
jgi:hypothetical protein